MESGNIVMGRIRRFARGTMQQVIPLDQETKETSIDNDNDFPAGLRVHHCITGKNGTVQAKFPGTGSFYEPWEIPVIWDGETDISGINCASLLKGENPVKKKLKKSELKPGMILKNTVSASRGTVRGKPDGTLLQSHDDYVPVRRKTLTGKNKGRWEYPFWNLDNVVLIPNN